MELKRAYVKEKLTLRCSAYGGIQWLAGEDPLPAKFRVKYSIVKDKHISKLIIPMLSLEDSGHYYCIGTDIKSLQVISEW